jgi:hypothetical protein
VKKAHGEDISSGMHPKADIARTWRQVAQHRPANLGIRRWTLAATSVSARRVSEEQTTGVADGVPLANVYTVAMRFETNCLHQLATTFVGSAITFLVTSSITTRSFAGTVRIRGHKMLIGISPPDMPSRTVASCPRPRSAPTSQAEVAQDRFPP